MKSKLIAWTIFGLLGYGAFYAASKWENPLDRVSRPIVIDQLPKLHEGCGKECLQ